MSVMTAEHVTAFSFRMERHLRRREFPNPVAKACWFLEACEAYDNGEQVDELGGSETHRVMFAALGEGAGPGWFIVVDPAGCGAAHVTCGVFGTGGHLFGLATAIKLEAVPMALEWFRHVATDTSGRPMPAADSGLWVAALSSPRENPRDWNRYLFKDEAEYLHEYLGLKRQRRSRRPAEGRGA